MDRGKFILGLERERKRLTGMTAELPYLVDGLWHLTGRKRRTVMARVAKYKKKLAWVEDLLERVDETSLPIPIRRELCLVRYAGTPNALSAVRAMLQELETGDEVYIPSDAVEQAKSISCCGTKLKELKSPC